MRILLIAYEFPNPTQTFVAQQARLLVEMRHDVTVLSDRAADGTARVPDGVRTVYLDRPASRTAALRAGAASAVRLLRSGRLRELRLALSSRRYGRLATGLRLAVLADAAAELGASDLAGVDLTICHFGPNGVVGMFARDIGLLSGPLAVVFHGYDLTRELSAGSTRRAYTRLFDTAEHLWPVSHRLATRLRELGAPGERISVVRTGIDPERIPERIPDQTPGHEAGSTGGPLRVVSVARLTEKKGIATAIRAVDEAHRTLGDRLTYDVIGDGPLRSELELAAERSAAPVRLRGALPHDQVLDRLGHADVVLAPSTTAADGDEEGIPVVLMEAMASGVPVVATVHAGIPELVRDGVDGILVDDADAASTASAIAAALVRLAEEPERRAEMGDHGRRQVLEHFDARAELRRALSSVEPVRSPG